MSSMMESEHSSCHGEVSWQGVYLPQGEEKETGKKPTTKARMSHGIGYIHSRVGTWHHQEAETAGAEPADKKIERSKPECRLKSVRSILCAAASHPQGRGERQEDAAGAAEKRAKRANKPNLRRGINDLTEKNKPKQSQNKPVSPLDLIGGTKRT
jgi:hypothetical protein